MICNGKGLITAYFPDGEGGFIPKAIDCYGCQACGYRLPTGGTQVKNISTAMEGKKTYTGLAVLALATLANGDISTEQITMGIQALQHSWVFVAQLIGILLATYGRFAAKTGAKGE